MFFFFDLVAEFVLGKEDIIISDVLLKLAPCDSQGKVKRCPSLGDNQKTHGHAIDNIMHQTYPVLERMQQYLESPEGKSEVKSLEETYKVMIQPGTAVSRCSQVMPAKWPASGAKQQPEMRSQFTFPNHVELYIVAGNILDCSDIDTVVVPSNPRLTPSDELSRYIIGKGEIVILQFWGQHFKVCKQ